MSAQCDPGHFRPRTVAFKVALRAQRTMCHDSMEAGLRIATYAAYFHATANRPDRSAAQTQERYRSSFVGIRHSGRANEAGTVCSRLARASATTRLAEPDLLGTAPGVHAGKVLAVLQKDVGQVREASALGQSKVQVEVPHRLELDSISA